MHTSRTIRVHRYSNRVALTLGEIKTVYLGVDDAAKLADMLKSCSKDIMKHDNRQSRFGLGRFEAVEFGLTMEHDLAANT